MRIFPSAFEFKRYGHLYALSLLLSEGQKFWFGGELFQACESGDFEKLRKLLIKTNPSLWMFAEEVDWAEVSRSALKIHESSIDEHNSLLKRLDLLKGGEA